MFAKSSVYLPHTERAGPGRGRVWIVDDSATQLQRASGLLSKDYWVQGFVTAEEMLERLSGGGTPDLLLLDWILPGVSGLEACRMIRGQFDEVALPILMLTSRDAQEDFRTGLDAGANDYVAKPYDDRELRSRVGTLVRMRQQSETLREREGWLSTTLASLADAVIATDRQRRVTFLNPVAEQLTGWTDVEARGVPLEEIFVLVDERSGHPLASAEARAPGADAEAHTLLVRRDGHRTCIEQLAAPLITSRADRMGEVIVFRDITTKKRERAERQRLLEVAQAARAEAHHEREKTLQSEEQLRRVVEASGVGLWDMDVSTGAITPNARLAALIGHAPDSPLTLHSTLACVHEEDRPHLAAAIDRAIRNEDGGRYVVEFRTRGNQTPTRWLESRGHLLAPAKGKPASLAGAILDVTARKGVEQALRSQAEFEQHLIGIVSHDLRNPLQTISLSANLLARKEPLNPSSAKTLVRIQNAADGATRMVNDLLDFTQARLGGGIRIKRDAADLHTVTRRVLEDLEVAFPTRDVRAQYGGDCRGHWDADRLSQVVLNLVSNALKYGYSDGQVTVETRSEGTWATLRVHNHGTPIPAESLDRIFEPLSRGLDALDTAAHSVGLGLYIVKEVVNAHGGTVSVESSAETGTTFTVSLPREVSGRSEGMLSASG